MKTFKVHRTKDVSGVSGTGIVAEGVVFPSGKCVIEWYGPHASIDINNSVGDWIFVHGHNGSTVLEYCDTNVTEIKKFEVGDRVHAQCHYCQRSFITEIEEIE